MTQPPTILVAPDGSTIITTTSPVEVTRLRARGYSARPMATDTGPQMPVPSPVGVQKPTTAAKQPEPDDEPDPS